MLKANFDSRSLNGLFLLAAVVAIVVILGAVILWFGKSRMPQIFPSPSPAASRFKDCNKIKSDCNTKDCGYYWMCDIADYKSCQVYDCGRNYGVEVEAKSGQILARTYEKPDYVKTKQQLDDCKGEISVVSDKCDKETKKITLGVKTNGTCPVSGFIFNKNNEWQSIDFAPLLKGNLYSLSIPFCEETSVSVVGKDGASIGNVMIK